MGAVTNIFRRGAVYYFRRRVRWPDHAITSICVSLRTRRLSEARRRAVSVAASCEQIRERLSKMTHELTGEQRDQIFGRSLAIERNKLEALHYGILALPNDDIQPQRHSDAFPLEIADMEKILREWITYGCPTPEQFEDLDSYLRAAFGHQFDELDRVKLEGGLGSLWFVWEQLAAAAERVLNAAGVPLTAVNRTAVLKTMLEAKLTGLHEFREGLDDYDLKHAPRSEAAAVSVARPEWPYSYLLDLDQPSTGAALAEGVVPVAPTPPSSRPSDVPPEWGQVSIAEAAERFLVHLRSSEEDRGRRRSKEHGWDKKTIKQFRSTAMLATKACPGPIVDITYADIKVFDLFLDRLPTTHHKSARHASMSLDAICDEAAEALRQGKLRPNQIGLGASTCNRHFFFLQTLFKWVGKKVPSLPVIDWEDFATADRRDRRLARPAYEVAIGRKLFGLPVWTGCGCYERRFDPGVAIYHDAAYWVLPMVWYSGMRAGEACAMLVDRVRCKGGIWYFVVDDSEFSRVKNETSRREVPIASELIRLGFLAFVDTLKARGEVRLFAELEGKSPPADCFYKKFGRGIRKELPFLEEGMFLQSMRHTVATELSEAGVQPRLRNDLLGHVNPSEGDGRYTKRASLRALSEVVELIPKVTTHLEPHPINLAVASSCKRHPANHATGKIGRPRLVWNVDRHAPRGPSGAI